MRDKLQMRYNLLKRTHNDEETITDVSRGKADTQKES